MSSTGSSLSTLNNSWSNCYSDSDSGILAKLRRLKIQEGLLLQNVNKIMLKSYENGDEVITISSVFKSFTANLRNSYGEIKNLFDSLKCNTTSHDALKLCDIDDIKTDVLDLEAKIKKFKNFLFLEQTSLKSEEQDIIKQINMLTEDRGKIKHPKIKPKPFSDIVPSPVKNIITCPLKCQEVQKFQDFLKSHHRYGGWNEYSHNIFIQCWIKYFGISVASGKEIDISKIEKSDGFISELIDKLPGINKEDIIIHSEWYLEYLHLKQCQQEALNKWKDKKKIIKKSQFKDKAKKYTEKKNLSIGLIGEKPKQNTRRVDFVVSDEMKGMFFVDFLEDTSYISDSHDLDMRESENTALREDITKRIGQEVNFRLKKERGRFHFAKSTQQWTNLCNDRRLPNDNISTCIPHLENIKKLCVPKWRMSAIKN